MGTGLSIIRNARISYSSKKYKKKTDHQAINKETKNLIGTGIELFANPLECDLKGSMDVNGSMWSKKEWNEIIS